MEGCLKPDENGAGEPASNENLKYMFLVEWFDPVAQVVKKFLMSFYNNDQTVELYDLKKHRVFLRRCKQEGIELENLYKSAIVTVMSRQIKILDYADAFTRHKFEAVLSQTFCMVKPDIIHRLGEVVTIMEENGLRITRMRMGTMTSASAHDFYSEHEGQSFLPGLLAFITSGPSVAMSAIGENAIVKWRNLIGPMDSQVAKKEAPNSLRAIFGIDVTRNGVHGSKDEAHVVLESSIWFPTDPVEKKRSDYILPSCLLKNTTLCIVKPHAVLEGLLGPILNYINKNGFRITALEMFNLDVPTAEEFLEIYKGVVPEYSAMVVQLTSGPCVACEIIDIANPECSQATFRKLAGPTDPEIAKKLRPDTIRALYGKTKVMNAVHCTDLPDDASLETEYFFKVLQL